MPLDKAVWAAYLFGHHPTLIHVWQLQIMEVLQDNLPRTVDGVWSFYWPDLDPLSPYGETLIEQFEDALDELVLAKEVDSAVTIQIALSLRRLSETCSGLNEAFFAEDVDAAWWYLVRGDKYCKKLRRLIAAALDVRGTLEGWRHLGATVSQALESYQIYDEEGLFSALASCETCLGKLEHVNEVQQLKLEFDTLASNSRTTASMSTLLRTYVTLDQSILDVLSNAHDVEPWIVVDYVSKELVFFGERIPFSDFTPQQLALLLALIAFPGKTQDLNSLAKRANAEQADEKTIGQQLSRIRRILRPAAQAHAQRTSGVPESVASKAFILTEKQDIDAGLQARCRLAVDSSRVRVILESETD